MIKCQSVLENYDEQSQLSICLKLAQPSGSDREFGRPQKWA